MNSTLALSAQFSCFPEYLRIPFDSMKKELYEDAMTFLVTRLEIPGSRWNESPCQSGSCGDKDFFHNEANHTIDSPAKRVRHD